jgi:hypothetical protein
MGGMPVSRGEKTSGGVILSVHHQTSTFQSETKFQDPLGDSETKFKDPLGDSETKFQDPLGDSE